MKGILTNDLWAAILFIGAVDEQFRYQSCKCQVGVKIYDGTVNVLSVSTAGMKEGAR